VTTWAGLTVSSFIFQLKRERGQPIFDVDVEMNKMARKCWGDSWIQEVKIKLCCSDRMVVGFTTTCSISAYHY